MSQPQEYSTSSMQSQLKKTIHFHRKLSYLSAKNMVFLFANLSLPFW